MQYQGITLNEHGDPRICSHVFARNSLIKNIFEEEKKFDSGTTSREQSPVILDLCLTKSNNYRNTIGFGKHCFQNFFHPHENAKPVLSNSSSLKSVFEKLCFRDGREHSFSNRRRFV